MRIRPDTFSLRIKIVLMILAPLLVAFSLLSYTHYFSGRNILMENRLASSARLGDMLLRSMRHSMLANNTAELDEALLDVITLDVNNHALIVDANNTIKHSSNPEEAGTILAPTTDSDCRECHHEPPDKRPRVMMTGDGNKLRVCTPIDNELECSTCHQSTQKYLGALLIDISLAEAQQGLRDILVRNLFLSLLFTFGIVIIAYFIMDNIVVKRIEGLHSTIQAYSDGDFSTRHKISAPNSSDELSGLGVAFNTMADRIANHEREQQALTLARQRAIVSERERIARELHDGVAQFIAYLSAKTLATRLLIQKGQVTEAEEHLMQIGQAVQEQSIDIRSSIVGLKMATQGGSGIIDSIREYITQYNRLSDLPIQLDIEAPQQPLHLDLETELHLIRIVQEAISNVRKHSKAHRAEVRLRLESDSLLLTVQDDGIGFNPWQWNEGEHHFGLQTMGERAEIIGADFSVLSEPGHGTTISVRLKAKEP